MATPAPQQQPTCSIDRTKLHPCKTNPRRRLGDIADLAESVRQHGILQPLLVRPNAPVPEGHFEVVYGHRRLAAAETADLAAVPCDVRELGDQEVLELGDQEVLELQVAENCQRADIHPLEEADAFHRLHAEFGQSVDEIAEKIGKSRSHVYARLKLRDITAEPVRKAFLADEISHSIALLLARIPDEKTQREAFQEITDSRHGRHGESVLSYRAAQKLLQERYMVQLKDAPFPADDPELVPSAGPCTTCPKRSGNQRELFADVTSPDVCTDPVCFRAKRDAAWKRRCEAHRVAGGKVLSAREVKKAAPYGSFRDESGFLRLDAPCYDDPKHRTYKQLLGKDSPTTTLAQIPPQWKGEDAERVELVDRRAAMKVLRERHPKLKRRTATPKPKRTASEAKADLERKILEETGSRLYRAVCDAQAKRKQPPRGFWRVMARSALQTAQFGYEDVTNLVVLAEARGLVTAPEAKAGKKRSHMGDSYAAQRKAEKTLQDWLAKASDGEAIALLADLLLGIDTVSYGHARRGLALNPVLLEAAGLFRVDVAPIRTAVRTELTPAPKKKKATRKKRPAKKKAPERKAGTRKKKATRRRRS